MTRHERRIIDAFKSNGINKMLLIDDAYDPPAIEETVAGLADFLQDENYRNTCIECGIGEDTINAATDAAVEGRTDNEALEIVYRRLYDEFIGTGNDSFDPGGHFELLKGPALDDLRPLFDLLNSCGDDVQVRTAGMIDGRNIFKEFRPQVLFLDYYLDPGGASVSTAGGNGERNARSESLELLRDVIEGDEIPAIVLMSSHDISDVDEYRHQTDKQILSLRLHFLKKQMVRREGMSIAVDHDAADALLDTSQGYLFGQVLQQALSQWKVGAHNALTSFMRHIGDLHVKDFAYLLRFRLREEGQCLSEYLEWLFGEYLKGLIEREVNWQHASFSSLDDSHDVVEKIEGAFEGPSARIAQIFHNIRVNSHRLTTRREYQLGDLYAEIVGHGIRAVITPDCDLVLRNGKMKRYLIMIT